MKLVVDDVAVTCSVLSLVVTWLSRVPRVSKLYGRNDGQKQVQMLTRSVSHQWNRVDDKRHLRRGACALLHIMLTALHTSSTCGTRGHLCLYARA